MIWLGIEAYSCLTRVTTLFFCDDEDKNNGRRPYNERTVGKALTSRHI